MFSGSSGFVNKNKRYPCIDTVRFSRKHRKHTPGIFFVLRLSKNLILISHYRIRSDHKNILRCHKLCMLFTLGVPMRPDQMAAVRLAMALYGGSVTSRLFLNVRERDHLCYYCSSSFQSFTGSMAVNSGVEHADAARAEKAILKELDDLRSGPITAEELEDCRRSLLSGMAGIEDTLGGIETWYYMEVLRGGPVQTPDDARAALQAVTEEDVRTVLRQLTLSVSYLLTREEESAHA